MAVLAIALTAAFAVACGSASPGNEASPSPEQTDADALPETTLLTQLADLADLAVARVGHTATVLADGRVVVIGGVNLEIGVVASVKLYDPTSGAWSPADDSSIMRVGHTATLLPDGRVLVLGGVGSDGGTPVTEAEFFDPATGKWLSAGIVLTPRSGHTATLLRDGRVLVVGENDLYEPNAELFDPETGEWLSAGSPAGPRFRHTATLMSDGRVLIAGGVLNAGGDTTESVEIFDPSTDTWSTAASLSLARSRHSAVVLTDGRVMVSSGASTNDDGPGGETASTEIFDPTANRWSRATGLGLARVGATVSPLSDGSLMIAGGSLRSSDEVATLREDPEVQFAPVAIRPADMEWELCEPFVPAQETAD